MEKKPAGNSTDKPRVGGGNPSDTQHELERRGGGHTAISLYGRERTRQSGKKGVRKLASGTFVRLGESSRNEAGTKRRGGYHWNVKESRTKVGR